MNIPNNWQQKDNKLYRQFVFNDFTEAISWMVKASFVIEKLNHHPEWTNIYNKIDVYLCTHDAGNTITDKDLKLAELLNSL
ncbi:MAG: 4a-hydroxytetrahydrobiopterin dehydratase [Bacteroidia bacterium]